MAHITSSWAQYYCLEDPARYAEEIFAADSSAAREADNVVSTIAAAARDADHPLRRARRTVADAWSAEQPCTTAARLVESHADAAHACTAIAGVAAHVVWIVTDAHSAARQAYADADAAIVAGDLLDYRRERGTYPGWDLPMLIVTEAERARVDNGRQAVVTSLAAALSATWRQLSSGAADAGRSLDAAPWDVLPAAAQPAVPHTAADTSEANLAALRADLSGPSGPRHTLALAVDRALREAAAAGQTAQLLVYDPTDPPGQGSVAIAIGDVDAASSVAVVVPGVGNSPATIGDSVPSASRFTDEIIAQAGSAQGTAATVLWWGYDIPLSWPDDPKPTPEGFSSDEKFSDTLLATSAFGAATAGARLAAFTATLRTAMPAMARLTLIGHSWGSIVVSQAALRMGKDAGVDDVVEIGSPGAGYQIATAQDYSAVDADHVYVVALPKDPVPMPLTDDLADSIYPLNSSLRRRIFGVDTGPFGPDPAGEAFGARVVDVPSEHQSWLPLSLGTHPLSNYLDGESLSAVAAIAAGNGPDVPLRRPR